MVTVNVSHPMKGMVSWQDAVEGRTLIFEPGMGLSLPRRAGTAAFCFKMRAWSEESSEEDDEVIWKGRDCVREPDEGLMGFKRPCVHVRLTAACGVTTKANMLPKRAQGRSDVNRVLP